MMNATSSRLPVSGMIVAYNEEARIGDCLKSLAFCDEILVVDSFSTDKTVELAKDAGARVIQRPWPGFRAQKEFGLSQVTHDWVINLDADERVSDRLRESVLEVLEEEARPDSVARDDEARPVAYEVNRLIFHLGIWWKRGGWYPEYRVRFFKKSAVKWGGGELHERVVPHGPVGRLEGDLFHFSYRDIRDQFSRLDRYSSLTADEEFDKGTRPSLRLLIFNPTVRFFKFYFIKRGCLEGTRGLVVGLAEAFYTFMKYAKLWDLYRVREATKSGEQR